MRYKQLTVYLVLGITILLFASSITASPSSFLYAQQQRLTKNTIPTTSATSAIGVKITSPARGQQVPVGSLTISGTSKDDTNSDCTVYALWDHLKPYQKVEPTGPSGTDDYSNWTFTYTSAYHLITNGTNQLTTKISCLASPSSATTAVFPSSSNLTKWYSINVTGITSRVNQTKTPVPIATTTNNTNINNTNTTTSATASTPPATPSLLPFPVSKANLNNNKNNNDDNRDQSGDPGKQDKKSSSSSDKQSSNENDNSKKKSSNNHDDNNKHNDSNNDKKSSSSDKQSSNDDKKHKSSNNNNNNNKNNDDHDDSKTDNSSSSKPHKKHDNSKSNTTTHHDDHSKKKPKHIIKEKNKEVKHKIKHLKKQINKKISKHI